MLVPCLFRLRSDRLRYFPCFTNTRARGLRNLVVAPRCFGWDDGWWAVGSAGSKEVWQDQLRLGRYGAWEM
jgi:hypothetical protein